MTSKRMFILALSVISVTAIGAAKHFTNFNVNDACSSASDVSDGGSTWGNVGNVYAKDNVYASVVTNGLTDWLWCTDFGFSIPSGATIDGIESITYGRCDGMVAIASPYGDWWELVESGSGIGTTKYDTGQAFPASPRDGTNTQGSSTDLWGATLGPSDVNASSFGVAFHSDYGQPATPVLHNYVDQVTITVYYTTSPLARRQSQTRVGHVVR